MVSWTLPFELLQWDVHRYWLVSVVARRRRAVLSSTRLLIALDFSVLTSNDVNHSKAFWWSKKTSRRSFVSHADVWLAAFSHSFFACYSFFLPSFLFVRFVPLQLPDMAALVFRSGQLHVWDGWIDWFIFSIINLVSPWMSRIIMIVGRKEGKKITTK